MTEIVGKTEEKTTKVVYKQKEQIGHLVVIIVHMKGLCGRPRAIKDTKYGMCVCVCTYVPQSLLSSLLIICCTTTIKKSTKDNRKKCVCVYGSWKTERCDPYDLNNY